VTGLHRDLEQLPKESGDRPVWSELMTALHSNGVRIVIVEKLDRDERSCIT
jgi:hypothetical protein